MSFGNVVRIVAVLVAVVAAIGSASSNQQANQPAPTSQYNSPEYSPPPPQQMESARALGLWRSTFGAVKIEADNSRGGLDASALQGIWVYQRNGEEVVGYFSGFLRGNVLSFRWQEPSNPPLTGEGYLVFSTSGKQYTGRWWSEKRDRAGPWNGWRNAATEGNPYEGGERPFSRDRNDDRNDDRGYDRDGGDDDRRDLDPDEQQAPPPRQPGPLPKPTYY
jgi:hypothetical protein